MSRTAQEEANLAAALAFFDLALNKGDFAAARAFVGPSYIQHNPEVGDGWEAFCGFIGGLRSAFPQFRVETVRALADGDLVVLHGRSFNGPTPFGEALADVFRFENGKIVEHWDVVQPIPATAANCNGMV
jgi:predicted SnoaL-like aldol condensation-catalyzing enzyme